MQLLKLNEESLDNAFQAELEETGMDFIIVSGVNDNNRIHFVIRGNGYAAPIVETRRGYKNIYTLLDIYEGKPLPNVETKVKVIALSNIRAMPMTNVNLPQGYLPTQGAHQLLGSLRLTHNTRFFRFTSSQIDRRFNTTNSSLSSNTYLTTANDQSFVNSGFGVVGRYALPMPVPASYLHEYEIPAQTNLEVGTVAPQFGQAGGGVEVKTIGAVNNITHIKTQKISDY